MNGARFEALGVNLFRRNPANPILTTADLPYPADAIFNPAAVKLDGETLLLARVEDMRGISHLAVCKSRDGVSGWRAGAGPAMEPDPEQFPEELWGIEDPRVTWLQESGDFAVVYTTYSRRGPQVSLATTRDFVAFTRCGSIIPPEDMDAALFPRRFGGRLAMLHRPVPCGPDSNIWISFSEDLRHWGDHSLLLECRQGAWWDARRVGVCPPPLETPEGWLLLYHGVRKTPSGGRLFRLGLALLDLEDPRRVLRRSDEWIFGPQAPYEREGNARDVIFPCGWIHDEASGLVRMYYGAADTSVCMAEASMADLLAYVRTCPRPA